MRNRYKDDKEEEQQEQQDLKFKDLKSANRKKRKEPPKPWGKRERRIVLITLLVTIFLSITLAVSARNYKLPGLPKLRLTLPSFKGETIVIQGSPQYKQKAERITTSFKNETNSLSGVYALYMVDLESGYTFGVNETEIIQAASLIKLPVIAAFYKHVEGGNINLDTKYTLKNSDKIAGSGSLYSKPAGTVLTYRDMIKLMGKESDNTSFGIIKRIVGAQNINAMIKEIGMNDTVLDTNMTSSKDIGLFFQKLWDGQIMNDTNKNELLSFLTDTMYENWIVEGIPKDIRVAHKYGREVHVVNDAGIVYSDHPFVLVLMSDGIIEREADEIFPKLAKMVYHE
ncbi:serine hydrolase [Patescibacteria group bacterium]